jgi:hypothetical protein
MKLDTNGLPPPGRELDAWIWRKLGLSQYGDYSTSAAFFQVMEAMESYRFHFIEHRDGLTLLVREVRNDVMWERNWPVTRVDGVAFSDYPDREHACAHAVCAAMWMAMQNK